MNLKFSCDQCQEKLEAEMSMAGDMIECPRCGSTIKVPNLKNATRPAPSSDHISLRLTDPIPSGQKVVLVGIDMSFSAIFSFAMKFGLALMLLAVIVGLILGGLRAAMGGF